MRVHLVVVTALAAACLVLSCGSSEKPDMPPDTSLTSAPTPGSTVSYSVDMAWSGEDPDGRVVGYDIAWHDGLVYTGTLDSLSWSRVTVTESTFTVPADSCPGPPGETCHGSHTFFVRAVDDGGAVDPTPASVSFNATTYIPRSTIIYPPRTPDQFAVTSPTCVKVGWEGADQDGQVVQYRYAVKPYEDLPTHEPPPQWSKVWSPWSSATETVINLFPVSPDNPWSFYVQAKDNAGAVENVFQDRRNHILIYPDESLDSRPYVAICATRGACTGTGTSLGCRSTNNSAQMNVPINVAVGDTLCFRADFSPGQYAKKVTDIAFRLNDPGEPGGWSDAAVASNKTYPPSGIFVVTADLNYIYVWVRDDYCEFGSINMAYIIINGQ